MDPVNIKVRALGHGLLVDKTLKLLQGLSNGLPPAVIGHLIADVLRDAQLYCPSELADAISGLAHEEACYGRGICRMCGDQHPPQKLDLGLGSICPACAQKLTGKHN